MEKITGVREEKWFNGKYNGKLHLVVTTADSQLGFVVGEHAAWMGLIKALTPAKAA